ncbi:MAG: L,D-transpeptidase family protein [Psychrosphaera sp.]|nr:L,D-transpeptidase family protein [Psychrosphaera sp.]
MNFKTNFGGLLCGSFGLTFVYGRAYWQPVYIKIVGKKTVTEVVKLYGEAANHRLQTAFTQVGVSFPPKKLALLAVKQDKTLELWAANDGGWKQIKTYPVLAASGKLGPKLNEGDRQVPEGIYSISGLNPNSSYHLSMKLNYPNNFDAKWAAEEGRLAPGSNIFIHGKAVSIGCLAMGDSAIEELFILTNKVGSGQVKVIIAPTDPRTAKLQPVQSAKPWVFALYKNISAAFLAVSPMSLAN